MRRSPELSQGILDQVSEFLETSTTQLYFSSQTRSKLQFKNTAL